MIAEQQPSTNRPSVSRPLEELTREFLEIPGFVGRVMRRCLDTAPYPNPVLAFAGAMALQSFLAGRQVRDSSDNRSNLYLIALARSGSGKDWSRKLNSDILREVDLLGCLGDRFASGEGLEDALHEHPVMLYQTDEFDTLLQSMTKARDHRYESIMQMLLALYSSSNGVVPPRRLAGESNPSPIVQPHLVVFGTAIPKHYYAALNERMLTNGLVARSLIIDAGRRGAGQNANRVPPPEEILEVARWWASKKAHAGGSAAACDPRTVEDTPGAQHLKKRARDEIDREYSAAEDIADDCAMAIWARVYEHICKLSLLYAVSKDHEQPSIDEEAVQWAIDLVFFLARRTLKDIAAHASESRFDASLRKCLRIIEAMPGQLIERSVLLKRMSTKAGELDEIVGTLLEREEIVTETRSTPGRSATIYQMARKQRE